MKPIDLYLNIPQSALMIHLCVVFATLKNNYHNPRVHTIQRYFMSFDMKSISYYKVTLHLKQSTDLQCLLLLYNLPRNLYTHIGRREKPTLRLEEKEVILYQYLQG